MRRIFELFHGDDDEESDEGLFLKLTSAADVLEWCLRVGSTMVVQEAFNLKVIGSTPIQLTMIASDQYLGRLLS